MIWNKWKKGKDIKKNDIGRIRKWTDREVLGIYLTGILTLSFGMTAFAADDPLTIINNLSDFIFSLIRAIGITLLGFGIVQLGLSLKSHDPLQRANGLMTLAGGAVITATREILMRISG